MSMDIRKGPWLEEEDEQLVSFVSLFGERKWDFVATASRLRRSGKSCRLRWLNYLRPNLKRGQITEEEEQIIVQLHQLWGNKWAKIARRLPGRTDNEIKKYWRTHLRKKIEARQENKPMQELLSEKKERNNEWKSNEEMQIRNDSVSASELSSVTCLMNLPYESRFYDDWMSHLSTDYQCQMNREIYGQDDDYVSILDPIGSLWNIT